MSYTIAMHGNRCEHCGNSAPEPEGMDPTWNLAPLFHLALTGREVSEDMAVPHSREHWWGVYILHARTGRETISELNAACDRLADERLLPAFQRLALTNNGWGTHEHAVTVMEKLREWADMFPDNTWHVE